MINQQQNEHTFHQIETHSINYSYLHIVSSCRVLCLVKETGSKTHKKNLPSIVSCGMWCENQCTTVVVSKCFLMPIQSQCSRWLGPGEPNANNSQINPPPPDGECASLLVSQQWPHVNSRCLRVVRTKST